MKTQPMRRLSINRYWIMANLVFAAIIAAVVAGPLMSRVEQPKYQLISSEGPFEVRSYGAMLAAEAEVKGERTAAIQDGFRLIAAYIFGANKPKSQIAMTAPVQQQSRETIAMTAPVTQQLGGEGWTVRFIMPSSSTLATLPEPDDDRVKLRPVSAKRFIVIRFSGTAQDTAVQENTDSLRRFASEHDFKTVGEPLLAFYNPPWTLPFFRRNEIMLELAPPASS
jgi:SOUL heme-binding protein